MKIHVIGAPRCGGTAYSHWLSQDKGLIFINEPFKFGCWYNVIPNTVGTLGGGSVHTPIESADSYISHHITSQYISRFSTVPSDHEIILIERKDKWKQLLSYCIMLALLDKYKFHNINYKREKVTIGLYNVQRMIDEWIIFDQFRKLNPKSTLYLYEDLSFNSEVYQKNTGYENIEIVNLPIIKRLFDDFWKSR